MKVNMKELNKKSTAPFITGYLGKIREFLIWGIGVDAKNKKLIEASQVGNLKKFVSCWHRVLMLIHAIQIKIPL